MDLTPIQIDFLRLFANLDNNNNPIENMPDDDNEFEKVF